MSELSKTYEPPAIEGKWYAHWLEKGWFTADPERVSEKRPAYSIVIPPPNVTGVLTLGHVLNNTIQDILARRARMSGKEVLWLPGTDHAGIATQNVVEKSLRKSGQMKHRDDLGREKLVETIWEWKEEYGGRILQQLRALGASCDWSRTRFTMDAEYSKCVQQVFVDLYKKGLIYRGKRIVNWCPSALTALSDEEVIMKPQNGFLYYFKVEVIEQPGTFLTIATTRPETIPGDTAIAVHPNDPRYAHLIGLHARRPLPLENQIELPIIAETNIDLEFGTGVLKVTPAHDKTDFEIGQRHQLATVEVIDARGVMNDLAGKDLANLDRFEARLKAVELLRESGLFDREKPHQHNVGYSERADVPIEPRLSEQWFLKYPKTKEARECVRSAGEAGLSTGIKFHPERWAKVYEHWMGGIQDWCISRQLWWGHRIPVWYQNSEMRVQTESPSEDWTQDPDVLDTWFSSWLWPFATMGWPKKTSTLAKFYPTDALVTGPDIIFFWVARMIMAGLEWVGEIPFKNVYFTGIIRDKQGRKMSKSLGNSPDPLDLIAKFGADALRFGVMRSAPLGQDILFDEKNVELGRNFCTKLWNAARFRQMHSGDGLSPEVAGAPPPQIEAEINPALLTSDDRWILLKLNAAITEVSLALDEYRFSDAAQSLYRFFWSEYCDWYLEAGKAALYGTDPLAKANTLAVMDFVFAHTLRLLHPFLPFITEELWEKMGFRTDLPPDQGGETIMFAHWPLPFDEDFRAHYGLAGEVEAAVSERYSFIESIRHLRSESGIPAKKKIRLVYQNSQSTFSSQEWEVVKQLAGAETLDFVTNYQPVRGESTLHPPFGGKLYLPLEGMIDLAAERERLQKEIVKVTVELTKVRTKLTNPAFAGKVPIHVLNEHQQREADWATKLTQLQTLLENLG